MIPKQLQQSDFRFVLLKSKSKIPFENAWQKNGYKFNDKKLLEHINSKGNYGVIGGYGNLRILDIDNQELSKEFFEKQNTFSVKTGNQGIHLYFISDYKTNHVFTNDNGELRANNYQVVGANSIHPNGNKYQVLNDKPIKKISSGDLKELIKPYLREETLTFKEDAEQNKDASRSAFEYRRVIGLIREGKTQGEVFQEMHKYSKWVSAPQGYKDMTYTKALKYINENKDKKKKTAFSIFGIKGQVEKFYKEQPFCYNKSGMFLVWDNELKKYDIVDDVDMLNGIEELGIDTINSKSKTEILNALKQYGRKKIPKDSPLSWVQFKDRVYDFKTGEEFDATPEYFMTNPMPYCPGENEKTPTIDKLFLEWVGDDYKKTLEEIAAYSACSDQFMQRMIALVGGGSNGKGTYNKFLIKLLGDDNTCSSEIRELSSNQFETSVIYKKQLCIMGEVSQGDLKNSNQLKKLSGEDKIRFCFKGKTPFTDTSITTLISNTNNLPKTPDKTMGFYRKWLIVDFPNEFNKIKHGIIENIPDWEMENFSRKILRILKELYKTQIFTNEGSFQERMDKYEERSNPIPKFIESHFEEIIGSNIELKHFCNLFNKFAKENHLSILSVKQIGKILREDGYETTPRKIDLGDGTKSSSIVILNLSVKTIQTTQTSVNSSRCIHGESSEIHHSLGSLDSNHKELQQNLK